MAPLPAPKPQGAPAARSLAQALDQSAPLAGLLQRLRESERRWARVVPLLPPELAASTRPGPLDEAHWTLLAQHAAAAAKLRQHLPLLQQALADAGLVTPALKVKVVPRI